MKLPTPKQSQTGTHGNLHKLYDFTKVDVRKLDNKSFEELKAQAYDELENSETAVIALDLLVEKFGARDTAEMVMYSLGGSLGMLASATYETITRRAGTKQLDPDAEGKRLAWLTQWLEDLHQSRS